MRARGIDAITVADDGSTGCLEEPCIGIKAAASGIGCHPLCFCRPGRRPLESCSRSTARFESEPTILQEHRRPARNAEDEAVAASTATLESCRLSGSDPDPSSDRSRSMILGLTAGGAF